MSRDDVTWEGTTETEALIELLGSNGLTEDRRADLLRALGDLEARRYRTAIAHKLVLHALVVELGTWDALAAATGRHKSTLWRWAHPEGTPMTQGTR